MVFSDFRRRYLAGVTEVVQEAPNARMKDVHLIGLLCLQTYFTDDATKLGGAGSLCERSYPMIVLVKDKLKLGLSAILSDNPCGSLLNMQRSIMMNL